MALHKKPQSAYGEFMREVGPKLVVYINKDAHPYAEKACAMAMVKCHAIQAKSSNKWSLTGAEVEEQIQQDLAEKLIPLLVYCTVGTTPSAIVDDLESIGPIAKNNQWLSSVQPPFGKPRPNLHSAQSDVGHFSEPERTHPLDLI
ncbi:hypothetical protein OSTOST_15649 [Ostertagia ostertagi]